MPTLTLDQSPPVLFNRYGGHFPKIRWKIQNGKVKCRPKRPWYMVIVKPNQDRSLARMCEARGITYLLPMRPCVVKRKRKEVEGMRVLFPGYMFVRCNAIEHHWVKAFRKHKSIVRPPDQVGVHQQLEKLFNALDNCLGPLEHKFPMGNMVPIVAGDLAGLRARIIAHEPDYIVRVCVDLVLGPAIFRIPAQDLGVPQPT